ncbi:MULTISPECIES: hotdog family protein [unclassified Photobacterium]|uniref:hotdog family protein n=1 Tax=unclassified Photobacterium TaxID=2628852 RepID=UPI000D175F62|nr:MULTISPECIES: hotdog family protein [unclassified Photobacterium]PSV26369.1 3-hydroxydecanoyl-ACP dehydratase [Photobacterium sp. GB-56]PSV31516.1 3-hydroxydecanoyl-ACP dehydratase [Photobacterium sp. GB-72]PSV33816.1 3-hydroxydecanoyl-ACP dehydratase [Photobacterium sp. GB-27]PSV36803.1 3-hydroxydecanoyl-ACP dehydratase [Photobacterium sp. GB-210]PSV46054.1 3-hydroxydecanoyl-ACP dehydratase [Photobacterium sp. GB-36]
MTNCPPLHQLLPHEAPMILVDDLIDVGEKHIHCRVAISRHCLYFDSETQSIPAYVGIEFMAQTVAGWSGFHAWKKGEDAPIGFLLGCRRYHSECSAFQEHEILDIHAEQIMENNGMAVFDCKIICHQQIVASSQLNAFVPSKSQLEQMQLDNNNRKNA